MFQAPAPPPDVPPPSNAAPNPAAAPAPAPKPAGPVITNKTAQDSYQWYYGQVQNVSLPRFSAQIQ